MMLRLRLAFTLLVLATAISVAFADDPDVAFMGGNRAYEDGRFADAEKVYRSLTEAGQVSEDLFLNLGNALYRLDRPGEAALWYRRALEIAPRYPEARQNLRVIKNRAGFHEFDHKGIDAWLARLSPGEIIAIISLGAWVALLAVTGALVIRRLRDWRPLLYITAGFAAALAIAAAWGLRRQATVVDRDDLAVVIADDASALAGPLPDAEKVVDLPPGSEVQILQQRGPWTYVGIPQDLRGWVRSDAVDVVRWFGPHARSASAARE